jgi:hypothetical protein
MQSENGNQFPIDFGPKPPINVAGLPLKSKRSRKGEKGDAATTTAVFVRICEVWSG